MELSTVVSVLAGIIIVGIVCLLHLNKTINELRGQVRKLNTEVYKDLITDTLKSKTLKNSKSLRSLEDLYMGLVDVIKPLLPLLEDMYREDIELVLRADYPTYESYGLYIVNGELRVRLTKAYFRSSKSLADILKRAAKLKELKSKLCCKKKTSRKSRK